MQCPVHKVGFYLGYYSPNIDLPWRFRVRQIQGETMSIVLKRDARDFLERNKDEIDFLFINGTLEHDEKVCGCCGPPPSPDYKILVVKKDDEQGRESITEKTVDVEKVVMFKINKQLYDAIVRARLNIVVFYLETTNEEASPAAIIAKFI